MKRNRIEEKELLYYITKFNFQAYMKNKTFLITGAKGLVGTGLIKWILLQNEISNISARIIASTRTPLDIPEYIDTSDNIVFCEYGHEYEINEKIDYIIHAASPTDNRYHIAHPVETFRTNIDGTENLIEIIKKNGKCSAIYLSSEEVYGLPSDDSTSISEDEVAAIDSLNLRSCYPLGKKASEFLCYASVSEFDLDIKIIRPTVIQGLFQRYDESRVVNELLRCILENKDFIMKSDGLTQKCMMYSLDAISAVFTVLFKGKRGNAYNASNPQTFLTVKDLAELLFKTFNPNIKIIYALSKSIETDGFLPHRTLLQDCAKLTKLGWEPCADLNHIYEIDIERFRL